MTASRHPAIERRNARSPWERWRSQFPALPKQPCRVIGCEQLRRGHELVCHEHWAELPTELQVAIVSAAAPTALQIALCAAIECLTAQRRHIHEQRLQDAAGAFDDE